MYRNDLTFNPQLGDWKQWQEDDSIKLWSIEISGLNFRFILQYRGLEFCRKSNDTSEKGDKAVARDSI